MHRTTRSVPLPFATYLVVLVAIQVTSTYGIEIHYFGSVNNVAQAVVPQQSRDYYLNASDFVAAYEIGTPMGSGFEGLGEAVAVNGVGYVRSTRVGTPEYYTTVSGEYLQTTGMAILPKSTKTIGIQRYGLVMSWIELLDSLFANEMQEKPFCVIGPVLFEQLGLIALAKPPIDGKEIWKNKDYYYTEDPVSLENQEAFVIGCAGAFDKIPDGELKTALGRVLYDNPLDRLGDSGLTVHTHVLLLNSTITSINEVTPDVVTGVYHLLSTSNISRAELTGYPITAMTEFPYKYRMPEDKPGDDMTKRVILIAGGAVISAAIFALFSFHYYRQTKLARSQKEEAEREGGYNAF